MPNSYATAEFILALVFVPACRWIKRNPSNFLRFALFPFGGINVARWPRFLLAMVRAAAILGFIAFLLAALNAVSPFGRDDLPSGSDYIKFGIAIITSFLALRSSAEAPRERRIVTSPFQGAKPGSGHPSPAHSAVNKPSR